MCCAAHGAATVTAEASAQRQSNGVSRVAVFQYTGHFPFVPKQSFDPIR